MPTLHLLQSLSSTLALISVHKPISEKEPLYGIGVCNVCHERLVLVLTGGESLRIKTLG